MDQSNPALFVPVTAFSDFIHCSICMNQLRETHTTPCGHRYCADCIKEWVNRKHNCPCCNHAVQLNQLIKDHQFDGLLECLTVETDKAETKYFEGLINQAAAEGGSQRNNMHTPIEAVLKKRLLDSLVVHEKFCQELRQDYMKRSLQLQEETRKAVSELQNHGLSTDEIQSQTADLRNKMERQTDSLSKDMESCIELVAASYDKYLSDHIPSLDILPVKVSIYILEKDVRVEYIQLKPKESLADVQCTLESAMIQKNNPIVSMEEDVRWFIFGPFAKGNPWEMQTVVQDILEGGSTDHPGVTLIRDNSMLVLQYAIKPNSELVVWGTVKCKSDMPKQCFVKVFKQGESKCVDYFSCKRCGFNWVCRSCTEVCHQGHEVVPYIMDHRPTWACCYCPKKKTCVIQGVST